MAATAIKVPSIQDATGHERIDLVVVGMTCAACVRRVDKALRAVDGVVDANVNLVTHRATITIEAPCLRRSVEQDVRIGALISSDLVVGQTVKLNGAERSCGRGDPLLSGSHVFPRSDANGRIDASS